MWLAWIGCARMPPYKDTSEHLAHGLEHCLGGHEMRNNSSPASPLQPEYTSRSLWMLRPHLRCSNSC